MKKDSSKVNKARKIFGGGSSLQINGDDASRLVGGIVEKGFSDQPKSNTNRPMGPSSVPRPTVLPFPVARHRSHGPHWNAMSDNGIGGADNDHEGDDEDDGDLSGSNFMSAFANPVRRKEKKGLNFSKWQEIMTKGNDSAPYKMEGNKLSVEPKERNQMSEVAAKNNDQLHRMPHDDGAEAPVSAMDEKGAAVMEVVKEQEPEISDMDIAIEQNNLNHTPPMQTSYQLEATMQNGIAEIQGETMKEMESNLSEVSGNQMEVDTEMQSTSISNIASGFTPHRSINEEGSMSLESQIDAENRGRLGRMSADEIAEARAEIMAKMRPELIQALRNRGQEKLKKQKSSSSNMAISGGAGNLRSDTNQAKVSALPESGSSNNMMKAELKDRGQDNTVPEPSAKSSSLWDTWTKRVEGVREIRFSIDGNVVEGDFAQVPGTGKASGQSGYSANNVSERDFLRTEGDPGAAGYSISEAVALCRSVVPGQRALALHLIASILGRALWNIQQNPMGCSLEYAGTHGSIDWEAIWAFALGPEPELALSLRMCLDDNHTSVVLACAKAIQCVLSCDMNEDYFDISEKTPTVWKDVFTAPVFRNRPEIDGGFLHGGFWKFNTKPSNIVPFREGSAEEETEGGHTIKDDVVVTGQDIAAGLVRMGILQRIVYLLETDPSGVLDECLISILVAIARHSPNCAAAIMNCQRLVQTVVNRFIMIDQTEINPSKIKSVTLLKVLACVEKKNCVEFIKSGVFQKMMWHLYRPAISIDQWVKSGKEACKLSSALLVEQLRFWKVCIEHGHCISYFSDLFPALSIWLNAPDLEKLIEKKVLSEYAAVTKELYLVLESLTRRLPNFYSNMDQTGQGTTEEAESWCWSYMGRVIDLALEWTKVKNFPCLSKFFEWKNDEKESSDMQVSTLSSLLWLISSVMHMISGVLGAVIPEDNAEVCSGRLPWLPDFVPKIGLAIAKNGFFSFSDRDGTECDDNLAGGSSFLKSMCYWRLNGGEEISIASVCCLQGLVRVIVSVDKLIQLANSEIRNLSSQTHIRSREDKILADGILQSALVELEYLLTTFMKLVDSEWQYVQSVEMFGRGGPAPGVGVGWGGSGGGFFSMTVLLAQVDGRFLGYLLQIFQIVSPKDSFTVKEMRLLPRINSALGACLIAGPRDRFAVDKLLDVLLQVPLLRYLDSVISQFLHLKAFRSFGWKYEEEEYLQFGAVLASHFKNRWLCVKKKIKAVPENSQGRRKASKKGRTPLDTIDEEVDASNFVNQDQMSLVQEWAHQRLPLPTHWFLSPISTINHGKKTDHPTATNMVNSMEENVASLEIAKAGLFFILAIEAMSAFLTSDFYCFTQCVPVVWKFHALSVILLDGMAVLEQEKSRDVYETLQDVYGRYIDESKRLDMGEKNSVELLNFQLEIHESYSTFIETLVEQLAAVSYGDLVFGRQVAIYLHQSVESPIRLATWNALSNAHALELLPPLEKCIAEAEGYLEPVESDERILEAYAKSWVSDALDRAAARGSAAFILALHHLSSFIFENCTGGRLSLRNKLVKSLLRDCFRKQKHEGMMLNLIQYKSPTSSSPKSEEASLQLSQLEKRFCLLKDACEGNSSLVSQVEKLEASITQ